MALTSEQIAQHRIARAGPAPDLEGAISYTIGYTAAPNPTAIARTGAISVGDQSVTVSQAGLACNYSVAPGTIAAPGTGASGSVLVTSVPGCAWVATTEASWIGLSAILDGYRGQVITNGAAGYWRLGEVSGSTAIDASGNGHSGLYEGAYAQGVGGALADGDGAVSLDRRIDHDRGRTTSRLHQSNSDRSLGEIFRRRVRSSTREIIGCS